MLDSRATAAILSENDKFYVYIRTAYHESTGTHAFIKWRHAFASEGEALKWYFKSHPQGTLVDFDELSASSIPS